MRKTEMLPSALELQGNALAKAAQSGGVDIVDGSGERLLTAPIVSVSQTGGVIAAKCSAAFPIRSGAAAAFVVHGPDPRVSLWKGTVGESDDFDMVVRTTDIREGVLFEIELLEHVIPATIEG